MTLQAVEDELHDLVRQATSLASQAQAVLEGRGPRLRRIRRAQRLLDGATRALNWAEFFAMHTGATGRRRR